MKKLIAVLFFTISMTSIIAQDFEKLEKKYAANPLSLSKDEYLEYRAGYAMKYPYYTGELNDEVNIDSLFVTTIVSLKTNLNSATHSKYMNNGEGLFLAFVLTITKDEKIRAIDVGIPHHMPQIKFSDVELIEKWYLDNKSKLTWEAVKPAYNFFYRSGRMNRDEYFNLLLNGYDYTID